MTKHTAIPVTITALSLILSGCAGFHFNNRSVVTYIHQKAETDGKINNKNADNPGTVAAEKRTTAETAVNTSQGKATVTPSAPPIEEQGSK